MRELYDYIMEDSGRALPAVLGLVGCVLALVILVVTYGWAGLALGLAIPFAAVAVTYLTRSRRN